MQSTYSRFLKASLLVLVALALAVAPDVGLAKKKGKGKKGKKAAAAAKAEEEKPSEDVQVKAREHYSKGKEFYEAQNYAEAMTEFQQAYDLKPHPTVLKSIAECKLQTGDVPGAIATLEKVIADPMTKDPTPIQVRLDEMKAMMATLKVTTTPEGAGIVLDGSPTDKVTPVTIDLPPGDHELALNSDGYEPIVKSITLTNGEAGNLDVNFEEEGVSTEAEEPALADPFADESGGGADDVVVEEEKDGPPTAFWISAAVAGVGLVSGAVFGTMALGDEDDYKADPKKETKDTGERNAIIADVSFGVAAAAAVVGVVILLTDKSGEEKLEADTETAKWNVVPVATGDAVGVSTSVSF